MTLIPPPDDALTPGINSSLSPIGQVEFTQNVADVALHRLLTDNQGVGNLGIVQAIGNQAENLQLPLAQLRKGIGRILTRPVQFLHHPRGHPRMKYSFTLRGFTDSIG